MLEVKDLVKIYKTKGGGEVRALDGVSAVFPERGMVFILGKSGSGKSTLLNVCGGLDTPDDGEIIIKGRSSRDFSQSDFDSYRNTFVGFVFQEYNILDEFTVEDNIALALELQGKGKDRARVSEILKQVELEDYAKRKPNTLSGGQKQRVAIARALVKNPQIIMADEPTGALDSATGKQVFDTLKKLSEQKLVIVVSHDREFAEIYGDRIIELKDGKIISDVIKERSEGDGAQSNLKFMDDGTIAVKGGAQLSEEDVERINEFLRSSPKDLVISRSERRFDQFKGGGQSGKFRPTRQGDVAAVDYTPADSAFIRSRLPVRHAVKIGASSMKVKPFRLFFTILLSFIAFTMFGLFSTLTFYDPVETSVETYRSSDISSLILQKNYSVTSVTYEDGEEISRYEHSNSTYFTDGDLDNFRDSYGDQLLGVFDYTNASGYDGRRTIYNMGTLSSPYYSNELTGFATFVPEAWQGEMLTEGDITDLADDEIIISFYMFDSIRAAGLHDGDDTPIPLDSYADIVGKTLLIERQNLGSGSSVKLKVAGVYRLDLPEKYDSLKDGYDQTLTAQLQSELTAGYYQVALVSDSFYSAHIYEFAGTDGKNYEFTRLDRTISGENDWTYATFHNVNSLPVSGGDTPEVAFLDGRTAAELEDGEIVVSYGAIYGIVDAMREDLYAQLEIEIAEAPPEEQPQLEAELQQLKIDISNNTLILNYGYYTIVDGDELYSQYADQAQVQAALEDILQLIENYSQSDYADFELAFLFNDTNIHYGDFEVVGFTYGINGDTQNLYMSENDCSALIEATGFTDGDRQQTITNYIQPEGAIYSAIALPMPDDSSALRGLLSGERTEGADDSFYMVNSLVSAQLYSVNSMIDMLEQVFLWIGVVMAVFAMLLLFNFISVSITYKKKEIGILRAVGARSADVFKIFYSESAIITAICYVLAIIGSFIVCAVLNNQFSAAIGGVSIFVFGPLSWIVMLAIAIATSFIATFLPVYGIAKRKPVESIRAL